MVQKLGFDVQVRRRDGFWKILVDGDRHYEQHGDFNPQELQAWLSPYYNGFQVTDIIHKATEKVREIVSQGTPDEINEEAQDESQGK